MAVGNGLHATVPKHASATITTTQVGTDAQPEIMAKVALHPADLVDDHPTWVQLTAWQGGSDLMKGVVTEPLKRTGQNTWESATPVPVGGNWKTLLRVQDGRMLTASPIFMPADKPLNVKEVPVEAKSTRAFVPEIKILQRERSYDAPSWLWGFANIIVLVCSLAILVGISVAVGRVSRSIQAHEAGQEETGRTPTLRT
jgi:hypothetical protein